MHKMLKCKRKKFKIWLKSDPNTYFDINKNTPYKAKITKFISKTCLKSAHTQKINKHK